MTPNLTIGHDFEDLPHSNSHMGSCPPLPWVHLRASLLQNVVDLRSSVGDKPRLEVGAVMQAPCLENSAASDAVYLASPEPAGSVFSIEGMVWLGLRDR